MLPNHTTPATEQQQKVCTKCGRIFPATLEFFNASKRTKDGLHCWCKTCKYLGSAAWRAANPDKAREYNRAAYAAAPDKRRERNRLYKRENKEKVAAGERAWREANRDKERSYKRKWAKENRAHLRAKSHRQRARKRNAPGSHTDDDVQALYAAQEGRCAYCNVEVGDSYHVDHIVPLSRGGDNGVGNLAIACPPCNLSKGAKLLWEWIMHRMG